MKVINAARSANTISYFYDAKRDVFNPIDPRPDGALEGFGFSPTHQIIVDDSYTAQELDVLFNSILHQ